VQRCLFLYFYIVLCYNVYFFNNDLTKTYYRYYRKVYYIYPVAAENIYDAGYVRLLFDRMSASYEKMNYIFSFGFSLRWRLQFVNNLQPAPGKIKVLDIMTGMGETWHALTRKYPEAEWHALDFSQGMLKSAGKRNKQRYNNRFILHEADMFNNGFEAQSFDVVTCAFGLKTLSAEQVAHLALELKRLLKPGGQVAMIEVSVPPNLLLRRLYMFYIGVIVPFAGKMLLGNPREYRMLGVYSRNFGNSESAARTFADRGFTVRFNNFFYGCATGFTGISV